MKSAPKRSAPGREIAGAAKLRLEESYQPCPHNATRVEQMPDGHIHHARELCANCGAYLGWVPKPTTLHRQKINELKLKRLGAAMLDGWAKKFVADMQGKRTWLRKYHHLGIPTAEKREGEVHLKHLKVYVSGYKESCYHIEWMRYERDSPYPKLVKTIPHVAF